MSIANAIQAQVSLAKNNRKKLQALSETMHQIITSLQGLNELPNNRQFI